MAKKTKKKKANSKKQGNKTSSGGGFFRFLKDERVKVSLGLFFIGLAILFALSFTSYLFTWKGDQSKLDTPLVKLFTDASPVPTISYPVP